jgi:hypothetical protein
VVSTKGRIVTQKVPICWPWPTAKAISDFLVFGGDLFSAKNSLNGHTATSGCSDDWLAQLGDQPVGLRRLVKTARARWRVEMDYRELKEELGLDHYEGRHWLGWHHHVTLVTLAFAFLRSEQVGAKKNFWCDAANTASD